MKKIISLIIGILIFNNIAFCETIRATTENGEKVNLYDDGTWRYEKIEKTQGDSYKYSNSANKYVKGNKNTYRLLFNENDWNLTDNDINPDAEFIFLHKDKDAYAMIIAERIQMSNDALTNVAFTNLKDNAPDTKIIFKGKRIVNGNEVTCLQMNGTVSGIPISYLGYFYTGNAGSIQVITYTGQNLFNEYKADMEAFLNGLEILK